MRLLWVWLLLAATAGAMVPRLNLSLARNIPEESRFRNMQSFLIVDSEEPKKIRLCKCSEVNQCQSLGRAEVNFCTNKCLHHLEFSHLTIATQSIMECFTETAQELELWNNCFRREKQFCDRENLQLDGGNVTTSFTFNADYETFVKKAPSVVVKKARRVYAMMRSYQHCYNLCAKKAESQCLLSNGCKANYPAAEVIVQFANTCDGLFSKALRSAQNSCECLVQKRKIVKLTGLCEYVGNRFLMTVL